jgi:hypothetical protein
MGTVLLIVVVLAAIATIASGVWVAVGLLAALRSPRGAADAGEGTDDHDVA